MVFDNEEEDSDPTVLWSANKYDEKFVLEWGETGPSLEIGGLIKCCNFALNFMTGLVFCFSLIELKPFLGSVQDVMQNVTDQALAQSVFFSAQHIAQYIARNDEFALWCSPRLELAVGTVTFAGTLQECADKYESEIKRLAGGDFTLLPEMANGPPLLDVPLDGRKVLSRQRTGANWHPRQPSPN